MTFPNVVSALTTLSFCRPPVLSALAEKYAAVASAAEAFSSATLIRSGEDLSVSLTSSARDIDANRSRKYARSFLFLQHPDGGEFRGQDAFPHELDGSIVAQSTSPSGRRRAIFKSVGKAIELEIFEGGRCARRLQVKKIKQVVSDAWFGGLSWSPDERYLAFVAEPEVESKTFFEADRKADDAAAEGTAFLFQDDWGEKYTGVREPKVHVIDTSGEVAGAQAIPLPPGTVCAGQPHFAPSGAGGCRLAFTAWGEQPRRLGMIYCFQRPCAVYTTDIGALLALGREAAGEGSGAGKEKAKGEEHEVAFERASGDLALARSPRWSPDGERIAFLGSREGFDTHNGALALYLREGAGGLRELVPEVEQPEWSGDAMAFPGVWCTGLPEDVWQGGAAGAEALVLGTVWGSTAAVITVDVASGSVRRVGAEDGGAGFGPRSSLSLLAASGGRILVARSSPVRPAELQMLVPVGGASGAAAYKTVRAEGLGGGIAATASTALAGGPESFEGCEYEVLRVEPQAGQEGASGAPFEAVLVLPRPRGDGARAPLVVVPHGGPHSCYPTSFSAPYAFHAALGIAVLLVNYRGSTGFGRAPLRSLPGRCGSQDVSDCIAALDAVRASAAFSERVDAGNAAICGGSHGGFLTSHLIGQHPDVFKCGVMRNPVTNIGSMATATDIPDWAFVEALGEGSYKGFDADAEAPCAPPTPEQLAKMYASSPVSHAHKVKVPTLLAIGQADRRVPPSQGIEYYHNLRARGLDARMLLYETCDHAIDKPKCEADQWVHSLAFVREHLRVE